MGAAAAAGDAGVHRRLRVHRLSAVRGAVAVGAARRLRVGAGRLLVSGDPLAAGRGVRVHRRALSLRLPARPHRVPRAHRGDDRRRAQPRPHAVADVVAGQPAAGAAGDRRRRAAGADGDDRRLRRIGVLRPADLHHVDLPRVVLARRPHRREPARRDAARARARAVLRRAPRARTRPLLHADREPAAGAAFAAARPRRRGRLRAVRVERRARLRDSAGCCSCACCCPRGPRSTGRATAAG